ncbi:MAG: hypothetical protein AB8H79_14590 [Myxococcota bacterium]
MAPTALEIAYDAFYGDQRSDAVPFLVSDAVRVLTGESAGSVGALICVVAIDPLVYLFEAGDTGESFNVAAADLERIE